MKIRPLHDRLLVERLRGANVADALLDFARSRNVTKIVVGKTAQSWWKRWLAVTVVEQLLARSADIDIYVITGEGVDYIETHLPTNKLVYRLLKAAESGSTRTTAKHVREEQASA